MCDFCEIVKKVLAHEDIAEEVLFTDGLCVAIKGKSSGHPIFIRRYHRGPNLKMFLDSMKATAKRMFPTMEVDEPKLEDEDHYYFYMRPKKKE